MMPTDGPDLRRRLADLMDDRRIELDLTWEEVARRAGVAGLTLRRVRSGESTLSRRTAAKIDRALEWQPGSVEGILAGGEPIPIQMDKQPLTERQKALKRLYESYERDYSPDIAIRMWRRDIAAMESESSQERPAG